MKYKTKEELEAAVEEYFDYCDNRIRKVYSKKADDVIEMIDPAPYTVYGLCRVLGVNRETLLRYGKSDLFYDTVKQAKDRIREDIERRLMETPNQAGAIFWLKNNAGWKDKKETDITSKGKPIVMYLPEKLPDDYSS